jgi:hypothetical protein
MQFSGVGRANACVDGASATGTFETYRMRRAMSEFEGQSGKYMLTLSSSQFDPERKFEPDQFPTTVRTILPLAGRFEARERIL